MIVNNGQSNLVRLGDYIELIDQRNSDLKFGISDVCGISNNKEIMPTRANVEGTELHNFFVVDLEELIYNSRTTRMGDKIGLGFNDIGKTLITSWNNTAFRVKPECKGELLPLYLFIYFKRTEFDRYTRYNSWGSSTEIFSWDSMCDIQIPLPDIDTQQELVDTYNGLKALAEQNEALVKPLTEACQAYIVDCKKKYLEVELGGYIDFYYEKNSDCEIILEQGINIDKVFINPHRPNSDLSSRIIVRKGQFAYCTQLNNENVAIAYRKGDDCVVSPVYKAFEIKQEYKNILLPDYIFLWLKRQEFGRYVYWRSVGSAYEFLQEENIREYRIPLPPPEVQQLIVNLYNCAEEAKKIATEAREKMKMLCPALVQRAING